jgi:hypothetical protein
MLKLAADDIEGTQAFLARRKSLAHLRVREQADLIANVREPRGYLRPETGRTPCTASPCRVHR